MMDIPYFNSFSDNFLKSYAKWAILSFCFVFFREVKIFIVTAHGLIPNSSYGCLSVPFLQNK